MKKEGSSPVERCSFLFYKLIPMESVRKTTYQLIYFPGRPSSCARVTSTRHSGASAQHGKGATEDDFSPTDWTWLPQGTSALTGQNGVSLLQLWTSGTDTPSCSAGLTSPLMDSEKRSGLHLPQ